MTTTRIRITDLGVGYDAISYTATCEADCKDSTDRSAYREAVRLQDTITMGKIIANPVREPRPGFPICESEADIKATLERFGIDGKSKTPAKVALDFDTRSNAHRALFETVADKANWKLPTHAKTCATRAEAQALADAITWFVGGAEINHDNTVLSRGYYFYIGA